MCDIDSLLNWTATTLIPVLRGLAVEGGEELGLRGYPCLAANSYKNRFEQELTRGMRLALPQWLHPHEMRYPPVVSKRFSEEFPGRRKGKRSLCDLFSDSVAESKVWIECKTVFENYLGNDPSQKYGYDWTGARISTAPSRTKVCVSIEEAAIDAQKLRLLPSSDADLIGLLVIGFDRITSRVCERRDFQALASDLARDGWRATAPVTWEDFNSRRATNGFRDNAWFWCRQVRER